MLQVCFSIVFGLFCHNNLNTTKMVFYITSVYAFGLIISVNISRINLGHNLYFVASMAAFSIMLDHIAVCCLVHNSSHHPQQQHFVVNYQIEHGLPSAGFQLPAIVRVFQGVHTSCLYKLTEFPSTDQIQLHLFIPIVDSSERYNSSNKVLLNRGRFPLDLGFFD
jgi:hypothetical protein